MSLSPGTSRPLQGGLTVAALVLIPLLAVAGSDGMRTAFDFTTGVLTLVSLTAAVAWGLLATDRLFLSSRQRLICQGIHRACAVASLGFLLLHGTVKIALGHVGVLAALVPFSTGVGGTAGLIGFGSLAGMLMIVAAATGAMRSAFVTPGRIAGRWRALHALAYPAWCSALVHGLYAGRQPATWVVVMYALCLTAVAAALALRLLPGPAKRAITERVSSLVSPQAPPSASDPILRGSPLPGAEHMPPPPSRGLPPEAPGWGEDDRGTLGTPVRPRTLTAPPPPRRQAYEASPHEQPHPGFAHRAHLHDQPTQHERAYTSPAPHERPLDQPLFHEPPPRGSERLATDAEPVPAPPARARPGFSAAYRAVSRTAGRPPERAVEERWPAPSPPSPAQAFGPTYTAPPSTSGQETEQLPGPLYPPPAGAPWQAPAGERP
ncbi:hypothetical protein ACFY8O_08835 [Streptomyces argenteolus]|uniref:DMSO/TMAO reductase YedYZ heme-binding membrane subunit n=1 Tax=Streptomyces argenteolus TaxID=67274 RepID=A0ABW6X1X7_9ACTN